MAAKDGDVGAFAWPGLEAAFWLASFAGKLSKIGQTINWEWVTVATLDPDLPENPTWRNRREVLLL